MGERGEQVLAIRDRQPAEASDEVVFGRRKFAGLVIDQRPWVAIEDRGEPGHPGDCELALAQFKEADLLVGGAKGAR